MTLRPPMILLALTGPPGSGKSTASAELMAAAAEDGLTARVIKLAAPLYALQDSVHRAAGVAPGLLQDRALTAFLGTHMRALNPDALTSTFRETLDAVRSEGLIDLVICDDARPVDVPTLRDLQFQLISVHVPAPIRLERLGRRGDLSDGDESALQTNTAGHDVSTVIANDGTLEDLRRLLRLHWPQWAASATAQAQR